MKFAGAKINDLFRGEMGLIKSLPVGKPGTILFVQAQNNNNVKVSTVHYEQRKSSSAS